MNPSGVSVLIPVKNEAINLPACLESVRWADEVFVVDSQSTDGTAAAAEAAGARVVQFHYPGAGPKKKNWSLANLPFQNEWVLILDGDERVPPALAQEIRESIRRDDAPAGYYVNRRLIFLGRWIRHCGWYPSWNLRLFRHRLGRYETVGVDAPNTGDNEVHEHVVLQGPAGYLRHDLLHHDCKSLFHFLERHNRYSDWDAAVFNRLRREPLFQRDSLTGAVARKRLLKRVWVRLPCRPLLFFLYLFILRAGFLDGAAGWHFCLLASIHQYHISLKMKEAAASISPPR
jgi:glycosyltransferase involved in cell wall biosynthesis